MGVQFSAGASFRKLCDNNINKVFTTLVIRPYDNLIYCARSAITHLRLWQKLYDSSLHHFTASCVVKCAQLTFSSISNQLADI